MELKEQATFHEALRAAFLAECDFKTREERFKGLRAAEIAAMSDAEVQELFDALKSEAAREVASDEVEWWRVEVPVGELDDFYFPMDGPWPAFTDGTCRVRDAAHELDDLDELKTVSRWVSAAPHETVALMQATGRGGIVTLKAAGAPSRAGLIGILRLLGVTRAEIFRQVLWEASVIALAGTLLGLVMGLLLAQGLVQLVTRTINELYFTVTVREVALGPGTVALTAALGWGAALVAAAVPALEALRTPPGTAIARSRIEARVRRMLWETALMASC